MPAAIVATGLVAGFYLRGVAEDIAAGITFRRQGFRPFELIEVDDQRCVIASIGPRFTVLLFSTNGHYEFLTISNSRLRFRSFRKIVKYQ